MQESYCESNNFAITHSIISLEDVISFALEKGATDIHLELDPFIYGLQKD